MSTFLEIWGGIAIIGTLIGAVGYLFSDDGTPRCQASTRHQSALVIVASWLAPIALPAVIAWAIARIICDAFAQEVP